MPRGSRALPFPGTLARVNPSLQKSLDDALRPIFGPNLESYYIELERHDTELRAIPTRIELKYQARIRALLNAQGDPEEVGYNVAGGLQALQEQIQAETRDRCLWTGVWVRRPNCHSPLGYQSSGLAQRVPRTPQRHPLAIAFVGYSSP